MRTVYKRFSGAGLGAPWGGTTTPPQGDPGTGNHFWKNTLQSFDVKSLRFDTKNKRNPVGRAGLPDLPPHGGAIFGVAECV